MSLLDALFQKDVYEGELDKEVLYDIGETAENGLINYDGDENIGNFQTHEMPGTEIQKSLERIIPDSYRIGKSKISKRGKEHRINVNITKDKGKAMAEAMGIRYRENGEHVPLDAGEAKIRLRNVDEGEMQKILEELD